MSTPYFDANEFQKWLTAKVGDSNLASNMSQGMSPQSISPQFKLQNQHSSILDANCSLSYRPFEHLPALITELGRHLKETRLSTPEIERESSQAEQRKI